MPLPISARITAVLATSVFFLFSPRVEAQHLWWDREKQEDATYVYGEITVLATQPGIYYCGANWHPGEPAGGYCGIQHNGVKERRTIFSIWDTTAKLHPKVTEADPKTIFNRFGGEGEGAHTHMIWNWEVARTFQFFVHKQPGSEPNTTETRYYIFDTDKKAWLHSGTILSPNGDDKSEKSVMTFGGGLNSFLENFTGKDKALPKLALYRLWIGKDIDKMKCLTRARGDGTWGRLHDAYFLAEGDKKQLDTVFAGLGKEYGMPVFPEKGKSLEPISAKAIPPEVINALKNLPRADKVKEK